MAQGVWGIDLGRSSLKAVKLQKVKNELVVAAIEYIEYGAAAEEGGSGTQVKEAVAELLTRQKFKKDQVAVALPGHVAFTRFIKLPPVEPKRIAEIIKYEAQQQIPFPIDDVLWDYQVLNPDSAGEEMEVGLFAIKKELVHGFVHDLEESGLVPDILTIAPLAIYNFMKFDQDLPGSSVILDVGHEHTDLVIMDKDRFWIRNLPLAGQDITKALQEKFKLNFKDAEKLKKNAGKTKQAQKIFQVFEPVLKDFVGEIHRSVGFYKSQARTSKFEDLYLLGAGTKVIGMKETFSSDLRFRIHRVTGLQKISVDDSVDTQTFKLHLGSFAVAMGLAIQGQAASMNKVNLLPQEIGQKKEIGRKKPMAMACVALLAVWILLLMGVKGKELNNLERTRRKAESDEIVSLKGVQDSAAVARNKFQKPMNDCQALVGMVKGRTEVLDILQKIRRAIPPTVGEVYKPSVKNPNDTTMPGEPEPEVIGKQADIDRKKIWLLDLSIDRVAVPVLAPVKDSAKKKDAKDKTPAGPVIDFEIYYQVRLDAAIQPIKSNNAILWQDVLTAFNDRLTSEIKKAFDTKDVDVKDGTPNPQLKLLSKDSQARDVSDVEFVFYHLEWKVKP